MIRKIASFGFILTLPALGVFDKTALYGANLRLFKSFLQLRQSKGPVYLTVPVCQV